jgi:hypothetical protein
MKIAFNTADLNLLTTVLDQTCAEQGIHDEFQKEHVASRILFLAAQGERDFQVLREYAGGVAMPFVRSPQPGRSPPKFFSMVDPRN